MKRQTQQRRPGQFGKFSLPPPYRLQFFRWTSKSIHGENPFTRRGPPASADYLAPKPSSTHTSHPHSPYPPRRTETETSKAILP